MGQQDAGRFNQEHAGEPEKPSLAQDGHNAGEHLLGLTRSQEKPALAGNVYHAVEFASAGRK